jgi:hypothetical protein
VKIDLIRKKRGKGAKIIMNCNLGRMWKEATVTYFKVLFQDLHRTGNITFRNWICYHLQLERWNHLGRLLFHFFTSGQGQIQFLKRFSLIFRIAVGGWRKLQDEDLHNLYCS